jgi:2'-5' RNA ligase
MALGEKVSDLAHRAVRRARGTLGIQRAANFRRLEVALVLPLADEAHNYATRIQVELLRRYGQNDGLAAPPHLTLKLGFKTADLAPLAAYVDGLARETPPLEVRLPRFDAFDEGILFLDVEPTPELDRLRRRIVREVEERFAVPPRPLEGDLFRFHVTLAYGLPKKTFAAERARFAAERPPSLRFEARSIEMICDTGGRWTCYHRAELLGGAKEDAR